MVSLEERLESFETNKSVSLEDEVADLLSLGKEEDEGNIEYKRYLTDFSPEVLEKKSTQMQYRMSQGNGECFYVIGVNDDGSPYGQNDQEREFTLEILTKIAEMNDYSLRVLDTREMNGKTIQRILIRENNLVRYRELRIGIAGNVDAGKSTLVGTLCTGECDDGRGKTRLFSFNFRHEVDTGRTSSVSQNIVGYDLEGQHIPQMSEFKALTWEEIVSRSAKIVTLFDLCGHAKYAGTTYSGMSSNHIDYIFVVVGANARIKASDTTIEHIRMANAYRIPIVFILNKIDLVDDKPEILEETIQSIRNLFGRNSRKRLYEIKSDSDVINSIENIGSNFIPLFKVSAVGGDGLNYLHDFLNLCPSRHIFDPGLPVQLDVSETYMVAGVGTIIGGFLSKGTVKAGEEYYLGPDKKGNFRKIRVRSIHVKRKNTLEVQAGRYVCLGVPKIKRTEVKRGMVVLPNAPRAVKRFECEIVVSENHHTTVRVGYCPILILRGYRSAVRLVKVSSEADICLRKSKEAVPRGKMVLATFETIHRPCFVTENERLVLTERSLRIIGKVTRVNPEE